MRDAATELLDSDLGQSVLDSFPDPALLLDLDHRIRSVNQAYRRAFASADAPIGRRCYEVLHRRGVACDPEGAECPVRECAVRERSVRCLHVHQGPAQEEYQRVSVHPIRRKDGEMVGFLHTFRALTAASAVPHPHRLVGRSRVFRTLLDELRRAAESDVPVLLIGESGSGRRLAGSTIHCLGERRRGELVSVDAAALTLPVEGAPTPSPTLATSVWKERVGAARGGSLLVHEIDELPRLLQAELLALEERESRGEVVRAAAGSRGSVRLIGTTSRSLEALARSGRLLPALQARLALLPIRVPPLRERMDDLPLLVDSLLERLSEGRSTDLDPEARNLLSGYRFPGNVGELQGLLERASLLAEGGTIGAEHLQHAWGPGEALVDAMRPGAEILPLADVERRYLEWAVSTFPGNNSELARRLGVGERTLYRKLQELRGRSSGADF